MTDDDKLWASEVLREFYTDTQKHLDVFAKECEIMGVELYTILTKEFTFAEAAESDEPEVRAWLQDDSRWETGEYCEGSTIEVEREAIGDEVQELVAQGWTVKEW